MLVIIVAICTNKLMNIFVISISFTVLIHMCTKPPSRGNYRFDGKCVFATATIVELTINQVSDFIQLCTGDIDNGTCDIELGNVCDND